MPELPSNQSVTNHKQKIKCLDCGNKTVQQNPKEKYGNDFYCQPCGVMWQVTKRRKSSE